MRICSAFRLAAVALLIGAGTPASAFDPKALPAETPAEAFRYGFDAYRQGDKATAFEALEFAAEKGHPIAQWKLGRMYADGDGVARDDYKAFKLFSEVANTQTDEDPNGPSAPFVADAFVALGTYYRDGIPNSELKPNTGRARQIFRYAATYFGDPEAQLNLARMYYEGQGGDPDPRQAARWAKLSADKGNPGAQALLGHLLFEGAGIPRQPILGLMFLSVAMDRARAGDEWVRQFHEQAFSLALAEQWEERNAPR